MRGETVENTQYIVGAQHNFDWRERRVEGFRENDMNWTLKQEFAREKGKGKETGTLSKRKTTAQGHGR